MPVARYILLIAVALVVLPAAGATQEPDASISGMRPGLN